MPKSKNRKDHKKKVNARNQQIKEGSNRMRNVLRKELEAKLEAEQNAKIAHTEQSSVETTTSEENA
jgi:hypothetical protein